MTINELITHLTAIKEHNHMLGDQLVRVARDERESDIDDVQLTSNYGEGTYVVLII